jgi:hypothetical protein
VWMMVDWVVCFGLVWGGGGRRKTDREHTREQQDVEGHGNTHWEGLGSRPDTDDGGILKRGQQGCRRQTGWCAGITRATSAHIHAYTGPEAI